LLNTLYSLIGKVQGEHWEPIKQATVIILYRGEEFFRDKTDENGYFVHSSYKLNCLYSDPGLPAHLKATVVGSKRAAIKIYRLIMRTLNKTEVKTIRIHITVKKPQEKDEKPHG